MSNPSEFERFIARVGLGHALTKRKGGKSLEGVRGVYRSALVDRMYEAWVVGRASRDDFDNSDIGAVARDCVRSEAEREKP